MPLTKWMIHFMSLSKSLGRSPKSPTPHPSKKKFFELRLWSVPPMLLLLLLLLFSLVEGLGPWYFSFLFFFALALWPRAPCCDVTRYLHSRISQSQSHRQSFLEHAGRVRIHDEGSFQFIDLPSLVSCSVTPPWFVRIENICRETRHVQVMNKQRR